MIPFETSFLNDIQRMRFSRKWSTDQLCAEAVDFNEKEGIFFQIHLKKIKNFRNYRVSRCKETHKHSTKNKFDIKYSDSGDKIRKRRGYLRPSMEHAADIFSDGALQVMEGAVMPLRVSRITSESLLRGLRREREQERGQKEEETWANWWHGWITERSKRDLANERVEKWFSGLPPSLERLNRKLSEAEQTPFSRSPRINLWDCSAYRTTMRWSTCLAREGYSVTHFHFNSNI